MNIVIVGSSRGIGISLVEHLRKDHYVYGIARTRQEPRKNFSPLWANAYIELPKTIIPESIDALIFCAGSQPPIGPSMNIEPHDWFFGLRDNLFSAFNCIHAFWPALLKHQNERGKIVCFSGGGATKARPNLSAYACAKVGIVRLVETLAEEWRGETVDINAIAPGPVFTTMTRQILDMPEAQVGKAEMEMALKTKAQDHAAALLDIRQCIDWLLSDMSNGVSGKLIAAKWDEWRNPANKDLFMDPEKYVLRRVM